MEIGEPLRRTADVLSGAAERLRDLALFGDVGAIGEALREAQIAVNALQAAQAELAVSFEQYDGPEEDRCSTWKAWARDQLHLSGPAAARLMAAGHCQRQLPEAGELARQGELSADHVRHLDFARRHLDAEIVAEHLPTVLRVAITDEPAALRHVVTALREAVHPEQLDEAWIDGMAKEDVRCTPVPGGWHLNGFLEPLLGARFAAFLQASTAPRGAEDDRTPAQRRIDGLDELLTAVLAHGLPVDRGVRPQLSGLLDLEQLAADPASVTAQLAGFGTIGPRQLQRMICESDFTPVLTAGPFTTLDVGRTLRLATMRQRRAISLAQRDRCAGAGCRGPVVHLHHIEYWSHGGETDLSNLVGLCPRCHRMIHAGQLRVDPVTGTSARPIAPGPTRLGRGPRRRPTLPDRARRAARARSDCASLSRSTVLRT